MTILYHTEVNQAFWEALHRYWQTASYETSTYSSEVCLLKASRGLCKEAALLQRLKLFLLHQRCNTSIYCRDVLSVAYNRNILINIRHFTPSVHSKGQLMCFRSVITPCLLWFSVHAVKPHDLDGSVCELTTQIYLLIQFMAFIK